MTNKGTLDAEMKGIHTVAISGHIRPDGDCIGSCVGTYLYLKENYPQLKRVDVYLEKIPDCFEMISGVENVHHSCEEEIVYDLFIALDCSEKERLGEAVKYFNSAKQTVSYDHHISNKGYADVDHIEPGMSSASELVFYAMDPAKISAKTAEALYMGIVHDTGIFQYSNTSPKTMETAAFLMRQGVRHNTIIDTTFMEKSFRQNQLLGRALLESICMFDDKCIISGFRKEVMEFYNAVPSDLDGIVSQLRLTKGVEVAVFVHETEHMVFKVSMRSKSYVDVSAIAQRFGGGGHVRAAGCTLQGTFHDVCGNIAREIENQIYRPEEEMS